MKIHRLEFSIDIQADKTKIWKILWEDQTYREWAGVFSEGSYFSTSNLEEGSTVMFLAPDQSGIFSVIVSHTPNKVITFKHLGTVLIGKKQPIDEETKKWSGTSETYFLKEGKRNTTLIIEIDILDEHLDFMKNKMPLALKKIKSLSENL